MKILPGWRVDDFLFDDASCHAPAKDGQIVAGPVAEAEAEGLPFWVPRCRAPLAALPEERLQPMVGAMEGSGSAWRAEDVSMVPQWESQYKNNKRSRTSLWC
ncbi:hypothetical protein HPP92_022025 [Vanilla planifolia]|uniref:Uncharacterized protein n=1 Tax=Vanilla planifolia TaxID=51239 RepID=A0A835PWM8_VANPL|nr:hypothetical protein HPP92_022025 [Vanilla planifolia]